MATLAMDREPDMGRFMDTYKFDQDMDRRRDKFGGGTSLPLNSDGYEDKQRNLRDERHMDWMQQQEKPRDPVYYRVGTPEEGFIGLGKYEQQRQHHNVVRQKEYNDLLKKQNEKEKEKYETRRQTQGRPAPPQGPQIDYDQSQERARAEERRAYQDYMGKYQHPTNVAPKTPINYQENKRILNEERKKEYNLLMEKKAKEERYWAQRGKPVTPPGGLNIGTYDRQVKEQAAQKKKDYKEMLDQQKSEQLKLRAYDHVADVSPTYVKYRDQERPLVGSPRDVNYQMHEKGKKDRFKNADYEARPKVDVPPTSQNANVQFSPLDEDPQFKSYVQVEKDKQENKKRYAEELLQQKREHMFMRARQEPEVAILDRSGAGPQYQTKPPSGPGYRPRDERQTPRYWNDGKLSRGPPSQDSEVSRRSNRSRDGFVPLAFRVEEPSGRRPIPERPRHGQPPYAGQMEQEVEKEVKKSVEQSKPNADPPRSPGKQARYQPRQQSPYKPSFADPNVADNHRPPRSPNKEYNGLQAQKAPRERSPERPPEIPDAGNSSRLPYEAKPSFLKPSAYEETMGTPLAFKTTPYRHASPHNPAHNRTSNSEEGHLNFNDLDLHPRSTRRSLDGNRRPGDAQISPRRLMNTQYVDSDDVTLKRKEANVERRKEYNDYISEKNEQRQRQEQSRHTHNNKPAELVKNQYYSSEDYERFQKDLQKQQGEEYRDFLSKQYQPSQKDGLPLGQYKYEPKRLAMEAERNKEYNELLKKRSTSTTPRNVESAQGLNIDVSIHSKKQAWLEKQRNKEYNDLLKKRKLLKGKAATPPDKQGLPFYPGHYETMQKAREKQRNKEYNDFLKQKYGEMGDKPKRLRSARSEPNKTLTSFYIGNDAEHVNRKKMLEEQRKLEYHQHIRERDGRAMAVSKSLEPSANLDSTDTGLPIGERHYTALTKFQVDKRNNQQEKAKNHETRNRDWNYDKTGVLELRGDEKQQSRQRELRAERQQDYNNFISQLKSPSKRSWPEPKGQGMLVIEGEYSKKRQMYDKELREDFMESVRRSRENGYVYTPPRAQSHPNVGRGHSNSHTEAGRGNDRIENPLVDALGRYENHRQELQDERKRDLQRFLSQVKLIDQDRADIIRSAPANAGDETPLIHAMGRYEKETKKKMRDERKKEFHDFIDHQPLHIPPSTVKENLMPHAASAETPLVSHLGKYDENQQRFKKERHQEFHDFAEKHPLTSRETVRENLMPRTHWAEVPLVDHLGNYDVHVLKFKDERHRDFRDHCAKKKQDERNPASHFVFPTVAAAEKPLVAHMGREVEQRKIDMRQERMHDYQEYQEKNSWRNQKMGNPGRRNEMLSDPSKGPYNGLFQGLGEHGSNTEALNQERKREYNDKLDLQYAGKERPHGRPNWVKEPLPNTVDRGRSPMRNQSNGPPDQYQQMLDEKRREEASRRRYEDPEYQDRLAQGRGDAAPRYGY